MELCNFLFINIEGNLQTVTDQGNIYFVDGLIYNNNTICYVCEKSQPKKAKKN